MTSASTVTNVGAIPSSVSTVHTTRGTLTPSVAGTTEMVTMTPAGVHTTLSLTPGITSLSATVPSQIPTQVSLTTVTENIAPPRTGAFITTGRTTKPFPMLAILSKEQLTPLIPWVLPMSQHLLFRLLRKQPLKQVSCLWRWQ